MKPELEEILAKIDHTISCEEGNHEWHAAAHFKYGVNQGITRICKHCDKMK